MAQKEFYLSRPEDLPKHWKDITSNVSSVVETLTLMTSLPDQSSDQETLLATKTALNILNFDLNQCSVFKDDPNESVQNRDNDKAFNIIRIKGDLLPLIIYSTLNAYVGMLEESITSGTNLTVVEWQKLRYSYILIFRMLLNLPHKDLKLIQIKPAKQVSNETINSGISRWERGHYVFMTIIQGMIIAFNCFRHEYEITHNDSLASYFMKAAASLMWGSEVALKFAGDFSMSSYEAEVRPTLSPPIAPPGMSGLYWRDHEFLIKKILFNLKPILSKPRQNIKEAIDSFKDALTCAYDAHKFVCTRFVGDKEPSLISKKPAGDVLQNYKKNRLHVFNDV